MSQKQGPPLPGQNDWPTHFLSGCSSLVNLSAAAFLSALTTAIPGASNIETQHKSRFTHLHSTLLPQVTGQRNRRRLASPLHGTLTPGRISVGRPPVGRTGVSLSLTESMRYSLPQAVFRTDRNRWAPYLGQSLIEAVGENYPPSLSPRFYRWSSRILRCRLPLSERPRQVCIYVFGYEIFNVREVCLICILTTKPSSRGCCTKLFSNFRKNFFLYPKLALQLPANWPIIPTQLLAVQ